MSDEPVRGAPSIDAFSVEKVENDVRHPPVSPHSLSFFRSLVSFRVTFFCPDPHSTEATRRQIQFARVPPETRESMICQWFSWVKDYDSVLRFICKSRGAYVSDFRRRTRHLLQIWPRLIIRREMCTASTRYWVTAKTKVRQSVFFFLLNARKLFVWVNFEHSNTLSINVD